MDADTLRLILIVFGCLLLGGLYLWERRRQAKDADEAGRRSDVAHGKQEPSLGPLDSDADAGATMAERRGDFSESDERIDAEVLFEPPTGFEHPDDRLDPGPHEGEQESAGSAGPQPLLLRLNVVPVQERFDGAAIVQAAAYCDLEPGVMDIFHRYGPAGSPDDILFSMANIVNPGTFPFGTMEDFDSPGVTLFTQMDGAPEDTERLEKMLITVRCLADALDGEIQDGDRRTFTQEAERHLRERVMTLVVQRPSALD
ncbi:MAG: cell division protein ZipA C-terminal FtsZ-binding domain-containing protein [Pseudomonadota bacterium]|nr:cell division protein ZipA C-terminal FtsZ-binding domain-containing protein [Pseudomonadota bacterium]